MYVEVKHWKSLSKKMSTLGWSFAPIEMFINASSEQPTSRQAPCYYFSRYIQIYIRAVMCLPLSLHVQHC